MALVIDKGGGQERCWCCNRIPNDRDVRVSIVFVDLRPGEQPQDISIQPYMPRSTTTPADTHQRPRTRTLTLKWFWRKHIEESIAMDHRSLNIEQYHVRGRKSRGSSGTKPS